MTQGACYTIATEVPAGTFEVHLRGEIDLASSDELHQIVAAYARSLSGEVVVDLSEVTFFDVTGLGLLMDLYREAAIRQGRFVLRNIPPMTRRIIWIAGLEPLLAAGHRVARSDPRAPALAVRQSTDETD